MAGRKQSLDQLGGDDLRKWLGLGPNVMFQNLMKKYVEANNKREPLHLEGGDRLWLVTMPNDPAIPTIPYAEFVRGAGLIHPDMLRSVRDLAICARIESAACLNKAEAKDSEYATPYLKGPLHAATEVARAALVKQIRQVVVAADLESDHPQIHALNGKAALNDLMEVVAEGGRNGEMEDQSRLMFFDLISRSDGWKKKFDGVDMSRICLGWDPDRCQGKGCLVASYAPYPKGRDINPKLVCMEIHSDAALFYCLQEPSGTTPPEALK